MAWRQTTDGVPYRLFYSPDRVELDLSREKPYQGLALTTHDLRTMLNDLDGPVYQDRAARLALAGQRLYEIVLGGMQDDYGAMTEALGEWRKAAGL
jgi:hypothetical protein